MSSVLQPQNSYDMTQYEDPEPIDCIHVAQVQMGRDPCFGASWCSACMYDHCPWSGQCRAMRFPV